MSQLHFKETSVMARCDIARFYNGITARLSWKKINGDMKLFQDTTGQNMYQLIAGDSNVFKG